MCDTLELSLNYFSIHEYLSSIEKGMFLILLAFKCDIFNQNLTNDLLPEVHTAGLYKGTAHPSAPWQGTRAPATVPLAANRCVTLHHTPHHAYDRYRSFPYYVSSL